ncbi:MAG: hypothetical protein KAW47_05705, partial [Thermoplasmatales archaeon]|nr:hypothetical protein [Thermoplasmatales archaeon]
MNDLEDLELFNRWKCVFFCWIGGFDWGKLISFACKGWWVADGFCKEVGLVWFFKYIKSKSISHKLSSKMACKTFTNGLI